LSEAPRSCARRRFQLTHQPCWWSCCRSPNYAFLPRSGPDQLSFDDPRVVTVVSTNLGFGSLIARRFPRLTTPLPSPQIHHVVVPLENYRSTVPRDG
jgi:hypothetical protein